MSKRYMIFNNSSSVAKDIEKFFDENKVPYVTIFTSDDRATVFPPNNEMHYDEKDFGDLRAKIIRENKWFLRYS
jgi:hypothetical protein